MSKALISDIQHFSTSDGPGIRTTVFFKGCNLHCPWCHNPETWSSLPQLMVYKNLCIGCRSCSEECKNEAHTFKDGLHFVNRSRCTACGACLQRCAYGALSLCGRDMTVEEVLEDIIEDLEFYDASGGGVTLSGGEPLLRPDFCSALARCCKNQALHVILDTAGDVEYKAFTEVLPYIDLFYYDLKTADEEKYKSAAGGNLCRITDNLRRLVAAGRQVEARIPVIPGLNDLPADMSSLSALLLEAGVKKAHLLPYHGLAAGKYEALGQVYEYESAKPPEKQYLFILSREFQKKGIDVQIGE